MKVLLVPDQPGWAFDNRAKDLLALRWDKIRLYAKYQDDVKASDQKKYDLIYPMSLSIARRLNEQGIPYHRMAAGITSLRVFEKQMINRTTFKPEFLATIKQLRGINAWSDEIVRTFQPHCPIFKTRIGIDEQQFKPADKAKSSTVFRVGWVGRKDTEKHRELKGYDILLKAVEGLDIKLDIRTFTENYVPRHKMANFYQSLDCFVCSSRSEGLPNPVLEAASCGVPIISTKVGIVPELIRHRKNGIITKRTSRAIRQHIKYLIKHSKEREALGASMRRNIVRHWTWELCKRDWEAFFKKMITQQ